MFSRGRERGYIGNEWVKQVQSCVYSRHIQCNIIVYFVLLYLSVSLNKYSFSFVGKLQLFSTEKKKLCV